MNKPLVSLVCVVCLIALSGIVSAQPASVNVSASPTWITPNATIASRITAIVKDINGYDDTIALFSSRSIGLRGFRFSVKKTAQEKYPVQILQRKKTDI